MTRHNDPMSMGSLIPGNRSRALLTLSLVLGLAACGGTSSEPDSASQAKVSDPAAATASGYASEWGPALGSRLPVLDAPDQDGERQTLASLTGDQGMLLFLNRSADW